MDEIISEIKAEISNLDSNIYIFPFNLQDLPEHNNYETSIRISGNFKELFIQLNEYTNDCIYWFSTDTKEEALLLKEALNSKRTILKQQKEDTRVTPVTNNNNDSNVLYLGVKKGGCRKYTIKERKRKEDKLSFIGGRIIHHLGYYKKGRTQGLQLVHWAKDFDININLNVLQLNEKNSPYLYILEKMYAIKLKPVLGKH